MNTAATRLSTQLNTSLEALAGIEACALRATSLPSTSSSGGLSASETESTCSQVSVVHSRLVRRLSASGAESTATERMSSRRSVWSDASALPDQGTGTGVKRRFSQQPVGADELADGVPLGAERAGRHGDLEVHAAVELVGCARRRLAAEQHREHRLVRLAQPKGGELVRRRVRCRLL